MVMRPALRSGSYVQAGCSAQARLNGGRVAADVINRGSPEPYYLQLRHLLERQIADGAYACGDRLPSESELCRRFDLSRSTVRETLRSLRDHGTVRLVPRRGAFVNDQGHPGWMLQFPEGFFENEVDFYRRQVETVVLGIDRGPLPRDATHALDLGDDQPGVIVRRLRRLDGRLALYAVNHLLPEIAPVLGSGAVLAGKGSLNQTLRAAGWRIAGARRSIEAVAAEGDLALLLEVARGHPLLLIKSVSWGIDQRPFDYYQAWVRTDVVKLAIAAQAAPAGTHWPPS